MSYIIAEIGFNHEGDMKTAKEMIKAAAGSGANAVKFQTFRAFDIALPSSPHYKLIQCGEMNFEQHLELYNIADSLGVDFISTPFSSWAVELLEKVGVTSYKIASMDCTNKNLLKYVAQTKKRIFLSTGMATLDEIFKTLEFLRNENSGPVNLLHCISMYPPSSQNLNLEIIPFLNRIFDIPTGYSDHFPGTKACLAAAMLGASVIETHFTLDSSKQEGDHFHSVEPEDLKDLIENISLFNKMRGNFNSIFNRPDRKLAVEFRRGLYSAYNLPKGKRLEEKDFLFARPCSTLSPNDIEQLIGKQIIDDIPMYAAMKQNFVK